MGMKMKDRLVEILLGNQPSIFLYGSVVHNDFKLGWSDIDIICLCETPLLPAQANALLHLRAEHPRFRLFEGGILSLDGFLHSTPDTVVYWGTSGQRITDHYNLCPFGKMDLIDNGRLLYGQDCRHLIPYPIRAEIVAAIKNHYETIRQHGKAGSGWFLDIARCLYTLRTNKLIPKTKAGAWAMDQNLCPDPSIMERVLEIRHHPLLKTSPQVKQWEDTLAPHIQQFAHVLAQELKNHIPERVLTNA